MKIKCEYCKAYINDYDEKCPNCGAPNEHLVRKAKGSPKTIEELKEWYKQKNLPPEETTRFFIGTDYKKPRAFGIYKDEETGNFVVYKNKDNGQRAIRYEGKDEAYAVNELYLKLKEEIVNQKTRNLNRKQASKYSGSQRKRRMTLSEIIIIISIIILMSGLFFFAVKGSRSRGYYNYDDTYYYYQGGDWYIYNSGWERASDVPDELEDNSKDYYSSYSYDSNYGTSDFSETSYYYEPSSSSSDDWDSGSSWDSSDSWDSGGTDWGSDW